MRIVVAGALANKPGYGGEAWVRLAWVRGLRALGAEVLFLEELDPDAWPDDRSGPRPLAFFEEVGRRWGLEGRAALIDPGGESVAGLSTCDVLHFAAGADLLVNISGHLTWAPVFRGVRRRAYVDLDPGFTQFWHASGEPGLRLLDHDVHFTVGENIGTAECPIPTSGIRWLPLRQPVVLEDWPEVEPPDRLRFTTVASWRGAYGPVEFGGRRYGLKVHEFRKFARLAEEVGVLVEIALDIDPADVRDRRLLEGHGWRLEDPLRVASTPEAFRAYVRGSGGELSVAQGVYAQTRSGWFSDRSARYLATGRPVVVQDTGFGRRLPVGEGLLAFRTVAEAAAAAEEVVRDYDRHRAAARRIAEQHFDARTVLTGFLERALPEGPRLRRPATVERWSPGPRPVGTTSRGPVLVSGMLAAVPGQGGATWAAFQYVLGLLHLGWDVHFVEEMSTEELRPSGARFERSANARYFRNAVREFGLEDRSTLLLAGTRRTVGRPYADLESLATRAHVLLNLSGRLTDEDLLGRVTRRAYLDLDPAFTQLWHVQGVDMGLSRHTHFVTVGLGVGSPDCPIPTCGREWIPTLPPVVLDAWPAVEDEPDRDAWTTVANWRGYGSIRWNGVHYGQKAHAFRSLFELPRESGDRFEVALAIHPAEKDDLRSLRENDWSLVDPRRVAGNPSRYRRFVRESAGEVGVAKTGYVESRSGWFSDRSACYLASGRPVLAQETGFGRHLPSGEGLIAFRDLEDAAEGVRAVRGDYRRHARAARRVAEEYLDSDRVLSRLMRELDR